MQVVDFGDKKQRTNFVHSVGFVLYRMGDLISIDGENDMACEI